MRLLKGLLFERGTFRIYMWVPKEKGVNRGICWFHNTEEALRTGRTRLRYVKNRIHNKRITITRLPGRVLVAINSVMKKEKDIYQINKKIDKI